MNESFYSTILFWSAFGYSAGPFWSVVIHYGTKGDLRTLVQNYTIYFCTGWLSFIVFITSIVGWLGTISPLIILIMHGVGLMVIGWLMLKIYNNKTSNSSNDFIFNWKQMNLVTWSNPKCWLLIPIGFLSAGITDSMPINIALYWAIGIPIFYSALVFWFLIGKWGAKISLRSVEWFNLVLLLVFALYLGYEGWNKLENFNQV